ncbi:intraflagellar transport protein 81 homolog [Anneissia japonica]|uniref:intraflagellar transport protein 81 homolog n=1 Tax=Anneissia japonica TaxID=1529436 RepID=UPI0014258124|nr:intraflagellar transport protein 81 homolog [Anneissia japonica]
MNESLKYIVEQLNKPPFSRSYNLISFDSLQPLQLLQVLNDVLADINPQNKIDIREEGADQTAVRIMTELKYLRYKPKQELQVFRQGLVMANKPVIYDILVWLFQKMVEVKKRAYLARYLVKIECPPDVSQDDMVSEAMAQYEDMMEQFKELHKEAEELKKSNFSTSDIKKDIVQIDEEKEQLTKRLEKLKKKIEAIPHYEKNLEIARNFRLEQERQGQQAQQKLDQRNQLQQAEQRYKRIQQQLRDLKQSTVGSTPEGLIQKLDEENKVNAYLCQDKLPKEIENKRKACKDLERVVHEPAMGQADLDVLLGKIKNLNMEINGLIEKRMMRNDPLDDKVSLFRQQASIIARKKEAAAESLKEAKDEVMSLQQEIQEKRETVKGLQGEEVLKGDEFKRYVTKLRSMSSMYKKKRQVLAELRAELGILTRTEEILKQKDDAIQKNLSVLEAKKGISGYHDTQEELEKVSTMKSELDDMKGRTLEDISDMVQRLNAKIASKKSDLAPIIKELRPMRQKHQEMQVMHAEKKSAYDTLAAGFESNSSKLEQEVKAYREECSQEESRYHYLNCMRNILLVQQKRVEDEVKSYVNPQDKKKSFRELYSKKIQEQENLGKSLREKQKAVKENHGPSMKQIRMWKDFQLLMECKKQCYLNKGKQKEDSATVIRDEYGQEDRLVL